jgi:hypothetical protein
MKVFLVLFILAVGDSEPQEGSIEQKSVKDCWAQLGKLMQQPIPPNTSAVQYSCVVKLGEPA